MANPWSPQNGDTTPQSLDYVIPDAGGNAGGTGGNAGYLKRARRTYAVTGAPDKSADQTAAPVGGALTNRSLALTTGGVAQVAAALNADRYYLLVQNLDASEDLWLSLVGTAAAATIGSLLIAAKGGFEWSGSFVPTGALSVVAATTGHKITIWEG
jgi:hypothetical protein